MDRAKAAQERAGGQKSGKLVYAQQYSQRDYSDMEEDMDALMDRLRGGNPGA